MKKRKRERSLFKRTFDVIKKSSEAEKKKSEEKKSKKRNKPKGMGAKRIGMITFWLLFSFMFLVTTISIFGGGSSPVNEEGIVEKNKLFDNEGLEFSKNFVHDYFNWTTDRHGKERLQRNIEPYFLKGVESLGGIVYDRDWASSLDKRDIELKDVQKIDDNRARYVFKVKLTMKSKTDKKDTKIDTEKMSFNDVLKEENKTRVINGYNVKVTEKYISVPVYFSGEIDKFAIYDLPSFTFINEDRLEEYLDNDLSKLQTLSDSYAENNVDAFLSTFFESYSKDNRDKLNYILEDKRHQDGLGGTMEFSSIKNSKIYVADNNNNRFVVNAEVVLFEPTTKYEFTNKFLIVVKRRDQRYVVESLNDEKYVSKMIEKYISEREDSQSDNNTDSAKEENNDYNYQGKINESENENDEEDLEVKDNEDLEEDDEEENDKE